MKQALSDAFRSCRFLGGHCAQMARMPGTIARQAFRWNAHEIAFTLLNEKSEKGF
jgi:hypothetical protein